MAETQTHKPAGSSRGWNFHPSLPISMSPVFDIPPKPKAAFAGLTGTWFKFTPPVSHLVWAVFVYILLLPAMPVMQTFAWGWIAQVIAINFGAMLILATGLHTYLYVFAGQQMRLKFDVRPMEKSSRFTFGNQVWENVFWSLVSGTVSWTIWVVLYLYVAANGWVPVMESISASPIWFVAFFFVIRFWQSFQFYWIHRLIHMPFLFKNVHHLHHRNVNVGPWSGLSMHPVESFLYFSGILIHFVLPTHPIHMLFHMFALSLGAVISHSGFDKVLIKDKETIKAGDFHHQLHHRFFECNYGSGEVPLVRKLSRWDSGSYKAHPRA